MNWLIYIGGGILWLDIWNWLYIRLQVKEKRDLTSLSALIVWIWICWRFIK